MIYGYARVSTKGQDKYGNGLEVQEKQLRENGATQIFFESFTGTKRHRVELDKLLELLQSGDTVVVSKLDRIARSTRDGLDIIDELLEKDVSINILNMGKFDNTPSGKLMRTIFFAFAEFERDMIVERTQEGKAIARNKGIRVDGRPEKVVPADIFKNFFQKQKDNEMTVNECCAALEISRTKWYNMCKEVVK